MTFTRLTDTVQAVLQARRALGYAELPGFGWLELSGPDVFRFMQNRTSNDVLALQNGQGHVNTVLDRSAKIQGLFTLHRWEGRLWLLVEREQIENLVAQIEKFHIVEQFSITDHSDEVRIFTLQGPQSTAALEKLAPDFSAADLHENYICSIKVSDFSLRLVRRSLGGQAGYFLIADKTLAPALEKALQSLAGEGVELSPEALDILRIEAGLPRLYADLTTGTLLPGTGLEPVAVSYTKGCYLGQETVARVKTYGAVQRALVGLLFAEGAHLPLPMPNASILADGREIGTMASSAFSPTLNRVIAMAFLGKEWRVPGRTLQFEVEGVVYEATVTLLPFYREHGDKDEARLLLERGLNQFAENMDEAAIALLEKALALDDTLVEAYESLGVILSRHGRIDEAMAMMDRVLALDPDHVMAHTNLSIYWLKKGDKDKAEEEKARATVAAMRKKAKEAGFGFDDLDEQQREERRKKEQAARERARMFEDALGLSPDDPLGNFGLGSAYLEVREYAKAIPAFEKVIAAQPRHSVAFLSLGKCLEGTGRKDEALCIYERGIEAAAAKGDLMPLTEMQQRLQALQ